jgi:hypothetical protein
MSAPRTADVLPWFERPGVRQAVVFLLLVNFALYAREDWLAAAALAGSGAGVLQWTNAFATTLDEAAWFILLFLFEFELRRLTGGGRVPFGPLVRTVRVLCCLLIAHTIFANAWDLRTLPGQQPAASAAELRLAWLALLESVTWLWIILLLLLDEREAVTGARPRRPVRGAFKLAGYAILLFAAAYWAAAGHWFWAWDELLWIAAYGGLEFDFRRLG